LSGEKGSKELPEYIKNRIWLKTYPEGYPAEVEIPEDKDLYQIVDEARKKWGDEVNMIFYGRKVTRNEIADGADRLATALHDLGVRKGDTVAIYLPNCPQFPICYFGALRIGAKVTAISPLFVPRELAYQLNDSETETLILLDMFYPNLEQIMDEVKLKNIIVVNIMGKKPNVEKKPGIYYFDELLERYPPDPPKVKINPKEDIAVLQYTGGTTGLPKGAMLTHYNVLANALQLLPGTLYMMKKMGFDKIKSLNILPWYHIYGQTCEVVTGALVNSEAVVFAQFDPEAILDAINTFRPWLWLGVAAMLIALLNHPKAAETDFSSLVYANMGAGPTPVEYMKKWKEVSGHPLSEGYGLTEACPVTHTRNAIIFGEKKEGSIGPPIPSTLAGIVDPETNEFLPIGEIGELVVSGPQVMKGYWKRPEETEEVFFEAGGYRWLKTGDIARMDEDGWFYIVDRTKDVIKYKGHSVYPREIEEVLYQHPAVLECAVIGVPDPQTGENIKAFISLKDEYKGKVTEQEIIEWSKKQLAAYKYPRMVEFVDAIPKTIVGKILRRVLREQEAEKGK